MPTKAVSLAQVSVWPRLFSRDADKVKGRVELGGNTTSSLEDEPFAEFRAPGLTPGLSGAQTAPLDHWSFRLEKSRSFIEQHLEKRVSQVFMQAVVCYRTGYTFREGHTLHQGLGAHNLHYNYQSISFQAAHSATVPCLYATAGNTEFVYLYRSGIYDESNATVDMVKAVNDADRAIDEKYTDSLLRKKLVTLLNKASHGIMTPEQVSKAFALQLLAEIDKSIKREKNAQVKDVLQIYRDRAELLWSYVDQPEHIDRWLNLNMEDPIFTTVKYETATRSQIVALIKKQIDDMPVVIRNEQHQKGNEARAPNHFSDLYHHTVLTHFAGKERKIVEEALGIRFTSLRAKVKTFQRIGNTTAVLHQNASKIEKLVQNILPLIAHLQGQPVDLKTVQISEEKKVCLRPQIYRLRYEMIRADQELQSVLKSKIESVLQRIKNAVGHPPHLNDFFFHTLLGQMPDYSLVFCKLLNISSFELGQKIREIKVSQTAHATLQQYSSCIMNIGNLLKLGREQKDLLTYQVVGLFNQMKSTKNNDYLLTLYYKRLFELAQTPAEKKLLTEILGSSEEDIDLSIQHSTRETAAEKYIQAHLPAIQEIVALAKTKIPELETKTDLFKGNLMKELRQSHGMSGPHFATVYKKKFPQFPMSAPTLCHLEKGRKPLDHTLLGRVSEIFGVHQNLFNPSTFAER